MYGGARVTTMTTMSERWQRCADVLSVGFLSAYYIFFLLFRIRFCICFTNIGCERAQIQKELLFLGDLGALPRQCVGVYVRLAAEHMFIFICLCGSILGRRFNKILIAYGFSLNYMTSNLCIRLLLCCFINEALYWRLNNFTFIR